jgi:Kef-type K+ transport system membrane component KefB
MEVDLAAVWREGKRATCVSVSGLIVPFLVGFGGAWLWPVFLGEQTPNEGVAFPLFFGTALSISALPVIARTLRDLKLYRTNLGMIVISAAVFDDLVGWTFFAVILGLMPAGPRTQAWPIGHTIVMTLAFAAAMLTVGRWGLARALSRWQRPGSALPFVVAVAFLGAAFTEWIGVHAVFGSFLVGIAVGNSSPASVRTRRALDRVVSSVLAPLFFAGIGLKVNFLTHFDLSLVLTVVLMATIGKVVPCALAAQWSGMPMRQAWAVGVCMNSRGAMEIILGLMALQTGLIGERMFVALVAMALLTSMLSGSLAEVILQYPSARRHPSLESRELPIHPPVQLAGDGPRLQPWRAGRLRDASLVHANQGAQS